MITKTTLTNYCQKLHIPVVGVAPWPLPTEAREILFESEPCPFTEPDIDVRLSGNTDFTPHSAIVCLFPYYVPHTGESNLSRYTWSEDYHLVVPAYLQRLVDRLSRNYPGESFSIHCDTSPLADRYMAYLAGLGFYGKNHCFINPVYGSFVFIGTILTSLEIEPDIPISDTCLGCNRCITACPGQSLGKISTNRQTSTATATAHSIFGFETCKSYLTQKKGDLDLTESEQHIIQKTPLIFGCDVCQDVCPHNQNLPTTPIQEFHAIDPKVDVSAFEAMTNKEFKAAYGHKSFAWRGKKILIRNDEYIHKKSK